jgi:transposase-like protein
MNLLNVSKEFATEDACYAMLERMRWPNGVICLKCGGQKVSPQFKSKGKTGKVRRLYQCLAKGCMFQFTATTGTIFHDTHLPLNKWFLALALIVDAKKGISANQIKRHLGVSYKTAWHLCHRIRKAMQDNSTEKMTGTVEVDETYIGGAYDKRLKRLPKEKPGVVGLMQRGGRVHVEPIPTPSKTVLVGIIKNRVSTDAEMVVTDQYAAYKSVQQTHRHEVINHLQAYVRGKIHTNTLENFWSLLKRGLLGSYHKVSVKHLTQYLAEFEYRFNNREVKDLFGQTLENMVNEEKLPYRKLVG